MITVRGVLLAAVSTVAALGVAAGASALLAPDESPPPGWTKTPCFFDTAEECWIPPGGDPSPSSPQTATPGGTR